MESNMSQGHHSSRLEQACTDEELKALLATPLNHLSQTAEGSQQPLQKQPYGYGETSDSEIADMIDELFW